MYLKKLELHGFKSFAAAAVLQFEQGISGIVGPNGSGKSNVADALRFVLGEQSMKSVRSKKMEDLIFSGSQSKPRMNMASVAIHFDNSDKAFPLDFSEVILKRKVFRDGENQYFINDAHVRLKDLAELIAKAHLGLKGYTIINQGMGDAIVSASPKERREIIFEALGLKEFQMKKSEALLKLAQTRTNLDNAHTIIREIEPHLKFLKKQAEKIEERHHLEQKLREMESQYLHKQVRALERKEQQLEKETSTRQDARVRLEIELARIAREIESNQSAMQNAFGDVAAFERELFALEEERNNLSREIGKAEGMLALSGKNKPEDARVAAVTMAYVKEKLEALNVLLEKFEQCATYETLRESVDYFKKQFSIVAREIRENKLSTAVQSHAEPEPAAPAQENSELEKRKKELQELLRLSDEKLKSAKEEIRKINASHAGTRERVYELKNAQREKELLLQNLQEKFASFDREIGEVHKEKEMLNKEIEFLRGQSMFFPIDDASVLHTQHDEEIRRNIERMKLKLENIDLIDGTVKQEYEETEKRYDFLTKESEDLLAATSSLVKVIAELDELISERFKIAFVNINKNFNAYFKTLFGGGTAHLEVVDNLKESEEEQEHNKEDYGVDIEVSLPKKKTSGLAMLSGGERTLTSLALLFALVSTSPPPFLVLDEIDAPLDEANSMRFGDILKELKQHTQFIVITHNRETMRQADILYGVTMQDEGVSKLLSLKFEAATEMAG